MTLDSHYMNKLTNAIAYILYKISPNKALDIARRIENLDFYECEYKTMQGQERI